jgi:hypothetical protein
MQKSIRMFAAAALFSAAAFAETWTGTLVDAHCMDQKKSGAECSPMSSTSSFALVLPDGKTVRLDAAGNAKAGDALKNNADRAKNPGANTPVTAKVTGSLEGGTIHVQTIEVQ